MIAAGLRAGACLVLEHRGALAAARVIGVRAGADRVVADVTLPGGWIRELTFDPTEPVPVRQGDEAGAVMERTVAR